MRTPPGACARSRRTHRRAPLPVPRRIVGFTAVSSVVAVRSSVPPVPAATITRPRLRAALDAGRTGPLTLVEAPPGWGKTVLLSGWAADNNAAWLTLRACHSDSRRLWADVCEALGREDIALDDDVPLRLTDALAGATERPVLVLDDLHLLRGPALASLGELLVHGGESLHVVAATRSDPELPLTRLRLSGRLRELRAADLAFTLEEATALLEGLGSRSSPRSSRACSSARRAGPPASGSPGCRCAVRPTPTRSWPSSPATIAPSPTT